MTDVLRFLLNGPANAQTIGENFWPDKTNGASHGGPCSCAVSASYLLGRMRVKGWVRQEWPDNKWALTDAGKQHLKDKDA